MAKLSQVTDETFEDKVIKTDKVVVVDFGAEWCHPCKQLDPIVEELAEQWEGKAQFFALDIDENVDTTMKMGVMGVPTLILFVEGQPVERLTGFQPKNRIVKKFGPYLGAE